MKSSGVKLSYREATFGKRGGGGPHPNRRVGRKGGGGMREKNETSSRKVNRAGCGCFVEGSQREGHWGVGKR